MKKTYSSQTGNSPTTWMFAGILLGQSLFRQQTSIKVTSHPSESINLIQIFLAMFATAVLQILASFIYELELKKKSYKLGMKVFKKT